MNKMNFSFGRFPINSMLRSETGSGSEHTVDGESTEAEIHFVHFNQKKYQTVENALKHPDGLAVLGALIKEDDKKAKKAAQQILKHFPKEENWEIGKKYPLEV